MFYFLWKLPVPPPPPPPHKNKKEQRLSYQWLFQLQNKFRKIPLLVMYYLAKFDDMINIKQFFQFKNYIC